MTMAFWLLFRNTSQMRLQKIFDEEKPPAGGFSWIYTYKED
jgi:hypothetical protein